MSPTDLAEMRARLRDAERRAKRKMRRISNSGIAIHGTEFDPTLGASIDRLNRKQIEARIRRNEAFISRKTQFVADAHSRPIPIREWRSYKRAENAWNKRKRELYEPLKNIMTPSGLTIEQTDAMRRTVVPRVGNPSVNPVFEQVNRISRAFTSRKALKRMAKDTRQKLAHKEWLDEHVATLRDQFYQITDGIGGRDGQKLREMVEDLTNAQWERLAHLRTFWDAVSTDYEIMKQQLREQNKTEYTAGDAMFANALKQQSAQTLADAHEMIKWTKAAF